jgi:hypothetical protein
MRAAIASTARHCPSARTLRSSDRSCGERAIASENVGASAAISASGMTRQKLKRPWKPNGLPIGYATSNENRLARSGVANRMPCLASSQPRACTPIVSSSLPASVTSGDASASSSRRERSENPPFPTRRSSAPHGHGAPQ